MATEGSEKLLPRSLQGSVVSHETISAFVPSGLNAKPEARTVEDWLIWTYQKQQAHKVDDRLGRAGQPMGHARCCSVSRTAEAGALGAIIHGSGRSSALHPDAELVHELVQTSFGESERGLLIFFGETGMPPDWLPGAKPSFKPVLNGKY